VHCFSRSVDSHLCFSAMNPVSRPVFVTYVRVQAHVHGDDEHRARFRCSFSAKGHAGLRAHTGDEQSAEHWIHDREAEMRGHEAFVHGHNTFESLWSIWSAPCAELTR
jgi:hypothetical protein